MPLPRPLVTAIDHAPLPLVQRVAALAFRKALQQHPGLFDRLGHHAGKRFGFNLTDLDLSFVIHPQTPSIRVHRPHATPPVAASVSGPLVTLLALLEGRIDGDAMFFSRSLTVKGDMEAMLALRNALDDCGFDLPRDLAAMAGPLATPFRQVAEHLRQRALAGSV